MEYEVEGRIKKLAAEKGQARQPCKAETVNHMKWRS